MQEEIWKAIPDYEDSHEVSSFGRVRTIDRTIVLNNGETRFYGGMILSTCENMGYRRVMLSAHGSRKQFGVHQLVAMAFLGHEPCGRSKHVDHIDGNKSNNMVENLEVVSPRENISRAFLKTKKSNNPTGVSGIGNVWIARMQVGGVVHHLGVFDTEIDASLHYKKNVDLVNNGLPLDIVRKRKPSQIKGVRYHRGGYWVASMSQGGNNCILGYFKTKDEAIKARMLAESFHKAGLDVRKCKKKKDKVKGVGYCAKYKGKKWRAYCTVKGKFKHIGVFKTQKEAKEARDEYIKNLSE